MFSIRTLRLRTLHALFRKLVHSTKKRSTPRLRFEQLEDRVVPATVTWMASGSGNWDMGSNWSTDSEPTSSDTVQIDTAANATITIKSSDNFNIQSLTTNSNDTLSIAGTLEVSSGTSALAGPLTITGGTLRVDSSGTSLTANSTTTVSEGSLYAQNGGSLALPNLTSTVTSGTFEANGTTSSLNLSALTKVTQSGGWTVNAINGGTMNLSGLTSLTGTQGIGITDTGGSTLVDPNLTTLNNVSVTLDGTDTNVANPWTKLFNSNFYVSGGSYSLPGLTDVDESGLHVSEGGSLTLPDLTSYVSSGTFQADGVNSATSLPSTLDLPVLTKVTQQGGWNLEATNGGVVDVPGLTSLTGTQGIGITDTGGSTLVDPNLTTLNNVSVTLDGTDTNVANPWTKLFNSNFYVSGGSYSLPGLTDVDESGLHVSEGGSLTLPDLTSYVSSGTFQADGVNSATSQPSTLDLPVLTKVTQQGGWNLEATNGGVVDVPGLTSLTGTQGIGITDTGSSTLEDPNLTTLNNLSVTLDGTDANVANPWTKLFNSNFYVTGGSYSLPGLTDVDESGLHVSDGGSLTLPDLTSYASSGTFQADGVNSATSQPSTLDLPVLTKVTQQGGWNLEATNGGVVDVPGLTSLTGTQGIGITDTGGSTLDDPNLTTLNNLSVTLDGTDTNVTNPWTKLFDSSLYVSGGSYSLPGLTDVDESGLHVSDGGSLTLPDLTSYASNGTFQADGVNSATSLPSTLDMPELATVTQQGGWNLEATNGGVVDVPDLTSLTSTQGIGITDTGSSTLDDPNLTTLNNLSVTLDGTDANVANPWTKVFNSSLYVTGGSYSLPGLTDVDETGLHISDGGSLTLPDLTSYASSGTFQADGVNSATSLPSTLDLPELATVTQQGGWNLEATNGGVVDVQGLTSLTSTQGINITDTGSSTLEDPNLATLNDVGIYLDGTDAQVGNGWANLDNVTLNVSGGTLTLPVLTTLTASTFNLSGGAAVSVTATGTTLSDEVKVSGSGSLTLDGSPVVSNASVTVQNGATLTLPAATTYTGTATLVATGSGSTITLDNITLAEPASAGSVLLIEAKNAGTVALPDLTAISGGPVVMLSTGSGSTIDLSALQAFTSSGGATASGGGSVQASISLPAAPDVWLNPNNDDWDDGSAWLLGVPASSMPAFINTAGTVVIFIDFDEADSVGSIALGANDTIEVDDTGSLTTSGNVVNNGTLSVDAGGSLRIGGTLTQGASAAINEQIGGTPASAFFGTIAVTGAASLAGTFNLSLIDDYTPAIGQSYAVLSFGTVSGTFSTYTGLDEAGQVFTPTVETKTLNLVVNPTPPTFTQYQPPVAGVGDAISYQFVATGTATITYSSADLPAWASLSSSGLLTGTPPAVDTYSFHVTASNGILPNATVAVTLSAQLGPPVFVDDSPPAAIGGSPYTYQFVATGTGNQPIAYSATGLPAWAQINPTSGTVTGTPVVDGSYSFSVKADNGIVPATTVNVSIVVAGGTAQTITVAAGQSYTVPSGTYAGGTTFDVGANATLTIDAGTFTGGGVFDVAPGGMVDIIDSPSLAGTFIGGGGGNVQVFGGRLYIGAGGLTLDFPSTMFQWTGGQMDAGGGDLTNLGTMTVTAPVDFYNDGLLDNFGTIIESGDGNIQLGTDGTFPATLKNEASGNYLLEGTGGLTEISDSGSAPGQTSLDNLGTIKKTSGTGTSGLDVLGSISNTGLIEADTGTITISAELGISQISGDALTGGTWSAQAGAALQFPDGTSITTNAGSLELGGVGADIGGISGLANNSGNLTLSGGATFTTTAEEFINNGSLTVGPGSTFTASGTFVDTDAATLSVQIGGTPASGQFGQVAVSGTATLAGGLDLGLVNGYTPAANQQYPVMSFNGEAGSFFSVDLGKDFSQSVTAFDVDLNTTVANPTDLAVGNVSVQPTATAGQSVTVAWQVTDTSSNAATGSWQDSVYLSPTDSITSASTLLGTAVHTGGLTANGQYDGTLTAAVPALPPGNYYVLVVTDSLYQLSDPNRANNTAAAANQLAVSFAPLGTPTIGSFTAAGQEQYYQMTVPAGGSLTVSLASAAASGATALYISALTAPTPYNSEYSATTNQPNQTVVVPQVGSPTTFYILAESVSGAAATAAFTLTAAQTGALSVNANASPYTGGNGGNLTIPITGTNFAAGVTASLTLGAGTPIDASSIDYVNAGSFYATFPLAGAATGSYTLRVTSGGQTATGPTPVQVVAAVNSANPVQLSLDTPGNVRSGRIGTVTVTAVNSSNNDVLAPLLQLTSDGASLELPSQTSFQGDSVEFLAIASNGPAGILAPGESSQMTIDFLASSNGGSTINFQVNSSADIQPMDWASQESALQPSTIPNAAWPIVFNNFVAAMGPTVGSYHAVIAADATYLAEMGQPTYDLTQLVGFEIEKADALFTPQQVVSVTADSLPAPGFPLAFVQTLDPSIGARYSVGILGYGWTDNWDISVSTDAYGNVVVNNGGTETYFLPQTDGSYLAPAGDNDTLALVNGTYQLDEVSGGFYQFNPNGTLDYLQDANGNRIAAGYNASGQLVSLTDSNGESLTLTYNAAGHVAQLSDSSGQVETYGYDPTGNYLTSFTSAFGTTTYSYVSGGTAAQDNALAEIGFANGAHEFLTYNTEGQVIDEHLDGGAQNVTISYLNPGGFAETDAQGDTGTVYYDLYGIPVETIDPLGNITQYVYNSNLNLVQTIVPGGLTYSYSYDSQGDITSETDPMGNTTTFTYDSSDQVTSYTDPDGNTTSYAYNADNNLASITYADGTSQQYTYNPLGEAIQYVDAAGNETSMTYNAAGLISSETFADGTSYAYTYNALGNLTSATDAQGNATTFTYGDGSNPDLMTEVQYPDGSFLKFQYNVLGQRTQSVDQNGFTVNYVYNNLDQLTELTNASGNPIVSYTYDSVGNLIEKQMGNSTVTTYTYDADGNVLSITNYASAGGVINSFDDYTYDTRDDLLTDTNQDGEWVYTYNADGELTSSEFTLNATDPDGLPAQSLQYAYNGAGDLVSETDDGVVTTYTVNSVNEYTTSVTNAVTTNYGYDPQGNLTSVAGPSGTTIYTYNDQDALSAVSGPGLTASYSYNPFGSLIGQTVNGVSTSYEVDPIGIGNIVAATSGGTTVNYTYGLGLVSQVSDGVASYYDFGVSGNTAGITNSSGSYVDQYAYQPFGETTTLESSLPNPFTFVGQEGAVSLAGGLSNMRARNYDASTGQFVSNDPINISGGQGNVREYAGNAPTLANDPTGLCDNKFSLTNTIGTIAGYAGVGASGAQGAVASTAAGIAAQTGVNSAELAGKAGLYGAASTLLGGVSAVADGVQAAGYASQIYSGGQFNSSAALGAAYFAAGTAVDVIGIVVPEVGIPATLIRNLFLDDYVDKQLKQAENSHKSDPNHPNKPGPNGQTPNQDPADPNALIGPTGYGSQNFILDSGNLPYTIDFENDGTAAADDVVVTQQLDSNLDWSTFQLGSFGFGPVTVSVPAGLTQYQTTIHYHNTDGSLLNVLVSLDFSVATGLLTVDFTSLDPTTGQTPAGVFDGFLYPNDAESDGEGYIQYTVQPKGGLTTETPISQQASVVFDTNAPISTETVTRAIDATPPAGSVNPLTSTVTSTFAVSWAGTDPAGPGIATYDVYVSANGGAFTPWLTNTAATSGVYQNATVGDTYAFYTAATDLAGLSQPTPTSAQTTTTVVAQPAISLAKSAVTATSTVESGTNVAVTLQAYNAAGQKELTGGLNVAFSLGAKTGGQGNFGAVTDNGNGTYTAFFTGTLAGSNTIVATINGAKVTSKAPTIAVTVGPLSLSQSPITTSAKTVVDGGKITVTFQPEDAAGNKLKDPGLFVEFGLGIGVGEGTFSPEPATYNATTGVYTTMFTATAMGSKTITATVGGVDVTSAAPVVTVTPTAATLQRSIVTLGSHTIQSGNENFVTVTLQVVNANGQDATSGGLAVVFSLGNTTGAKGTFSDFTDHGNGIYTVLFTGTLAGSNTITASVEGVKLTSKAATIAVTVGPLSLSQSPITTSAKTVVDGGKITVTFQPEDAAGNKLKDPGLFVEFGLGIGVGEGTFSPEPATYNATTGAYTTMFTATAMGSNNITATVGGIDVTSSAPVVTVTPTAATLLRSIVTLGSHTIQSGNENFVTVTLQVVNANGQDATSGGLAVVFSLGNTTGAKGTFSDFTDHGNGIYTVLFTGTLAGSNTITASVEGVKLTSKAPSIVVTDGPLDMAASTVKLSAATIKAGGQVTVTFQPEDAAGNKLILSSLHPSFAITGSGSGSFNPVVNYNPATGTYTATFTGNNAGAVAISAIVNSASTEGAALTITPNAASVATSFLTFPNGISVMTGQTIDVVLQAVDLFGNLETTGGAAVVFEIVPGAGNNGRGTFGNVAYIGNGMYEATFKGTVAGTVALTATVGGVKLKASAQTVAVTA